MAQHFDLLEAARRLRAIMDRACNALPEEVAADPEMAPMFPTWEAEGKAYTAGDRVQYEGIVFSCLQPHNSQSGWTPTAAPSLWAKVLIPGGGVYPWEQPDSTNPYKKGDKVTHKGQTWESTIDGNVWEPGAYGWQVVS